MDKSILYDRIQIMHKNLIEKRILLIDGIVTEKIGFQIEETIDILANTGETVDIYINSPGGSADAFLGILRKLSESKMRTTTMCLEQAGCGAMLLLASGTRRTAIANSKIILFSSLWVKDSPGVELEKAGEAILKVKKEIEACFIKFVRDEKSPLLKELFSGRTLTVSESIKYGIIDSGVSAV